MKKFIAWLVLSSKDPNKVSLFVKGALLSIIPIVITIAGLTGIQIPDHQGLETVIENIAQIIQIGLGIVSAIAAIYGLIRKTWTTLAGKNEVINQGIGE